MRQARQQLEVWIDSDLVEPSRVGMLAHDRGQVRFEYDRGWLARTGAFPIDPVQQFLRKRTSLSPAFDLNPNVERRPDHILNIDDADNRPSIEAAMTTANFYRLDPARPLRSARKCSAPSIGGATRPNGPASAPQTLSSPKSRSVQRPHAGSCNAEGDLGRGGRTQASWSRNCTSATAIAPARQAALSFISVAAFAPASSGRRRVKSPLAAQSFVDCSMEPAGARNRETHRDANEHQKIGRRFRDGADRAVERLEG